MLHLRHNIKLIRSISGLTQYEFGKLFDATKAMIKSYESGKANPDELFITRLSRFAKASKEDLQRILLTEDDVTVERGEVNLSALKESLKVMARIQMAQTELLLSLTDSKKSYEILKKYEAESMFPLKDKQSKS